MAFISWMPTLQLCEVGVNPNLCSAAAGMAAEGNAMNTITVPGLAKVREPRGALWAARAAFALWQVLAGKRRTLAAEDAALREIAQVRALARHHQATDPGFAGDLLAAADRHESALLER
jgi:hypothetical protein